jgi:hypothetical protein
LRPAEDTEETRTMIPFLANATEPSLSHTSADDDHAAALDHINDKSVEVFFDYLGLGLVLTAVDILVRDSAFLLAALLLIAGFIVLRIGLRWVSLKPGIFAFFAPVARNVSFILALHAEIFEQPKSKRSLQALRPHGAQWLRLVDAG